jgi:hypothetical protein
MAQTAQERRRAQRRTARQLERGERPLGGEYQKRAVSSLRVQAHNNFKRMLGNYFKYDDNTVRCRIWTQMDIDEIIWTITADAGELRSRAGDQTDTNPFWYHYDPQCYGVK